MGITTQDQLVTVTTTVATYTCDAKTCVGLVPPTTVTQLASLPPPVKWAYMERRKVNGTIQTAYLCPDCVVAYFAGTVSP